MVKNIVFFTGAGISKESGIPVFRDSFNSLWKRYKIEDVATKESWKNNKEDLLIFYNERRKDLQRCEPNKAHFIISEIQETKNNNVSVITQNVDDLHEKSGTKCIIHLHGKLTNSRSSLDRNLIYDIGYGEINLGDKCEKGSQLRPDVVLFGEDVPKIKEAEKLIDDCDIFVVIGTSLNVYPAYGLLDYAIDKNKKIFIINPEDHNDTYKKYPNVSMIKDEAISGMEKLKLII